MLRKQRAILSGWRLEPPCLQFYGFAALTLMLPHHTESIRRTTEFFAKDPAVRGLLLGGSIAHGFQSAESDIDVMILVSDEDHRERMRTGGTCFFSRELCTYDGGYVDGKYTSESFLQEVRAKGSEPARFAFQDAQVLFARNPELPVLIADIARYPTADQSSRLRSASASSTSRRCRCGASRWGSTGCPSPRSSG